MLNTLIDISDLPVMDALGMNAQLQAKKNRLRKALSEKGVIKKDKQNKFDGYKYLSEAGYKELFTELFAECGLELRSTRLNLEEITGTDKMPFGRRVTMAYILTDTDTGFYEVSEFDGESYDKGDKAIYKAYTGSLKYYLANCFMVASGDEAESESLEGKPNNTKTKKQQEQQGKGKQQPTPTPQEMTEEELEALKRRPINDIEKDAIVAELERTGVKAETILEGYNLTDLAQLSFGRWKKCMTKLESIKTKEKQVDLGLE